MRLLPKRESVSSLCMNIYYHSRIRGRGRLIRLAASVLQAASSCEYGPERRSQPVAERFIVIRTVILYLFDGCAESTAFSQPHAAP